MKKRTDLALEVIEDSSEIVKKEKEKGVVFTQIEIKEKQKEKLYGKPCGKYITLEFESIEKISDYSTIEEKIKKAFFSLLPEKKENILIVGLGNKEITSDSIGPVTAEKILATRHVKNYFEKIGEFKGIKSVSVSVPNVLGKTGIEAAENVKATVDLIKPDVVIVIDALACKSIERLFRSIQLCNTGISPGSGVKNARKEISQNTLGVPVIAVGIPTVVDANNLTMELTGKQAKLETDLILTPKDADLLCHRICEILSKSINILIQPEIDPEIILQLV